MDIIGLPLHPLVVHAAVIFVPLAALGSVLVVFFGPLRERYAGLVVALGAAAVLSAFAAFLTGPLLAEELGIAGSPRIDRHMILGTWTPWPTLLMAVALPLFLRARRAAGDRPGPAVWSFGGVTVVSALAALVLVVLTGHAGATAVWG